IAGLESPTCSASDFIVSRPFSCNAARICSSSESTWFAIIPAPHPNLRKFGVYGHGPSRVYPYRRHRLAAVGIPAVYVPATPHASARSSWCARSPHRLRRTWLSVRGQEPLGHPWNLVLWHQVGLAATIGG